MRDQEWKMRNVLLELGIKMKPMLGAFFFIPISAIGSHCLLCFSASKQLLSNDQRKGSRIVKIFVSSV